MKKFEEPSQHFHNQISWSWLISDISYQGGCLISRHSHRSTFTPLICQSIGVPHLPNLRFSLGSNNLLSASCAWMKNWTTDPLLKKYILIWRTVGPPTNTMLTHFCSRLTRLA